MHQIIFLWKKNSVYSLSDDNAIINLLKSYFLPKSDIHFFNVYYDSYEEYYEEYEDRYEYYENDDDDEY